GIAAFVVAAVALFGTLSADFLGAAGPALRRRAPWLVVLGLFLTVWELATAKFAWLPLPFFPPPQAILEVYTDDLPKLLDSVFASVKLQVGGYVVGATIGFLTGVSIGWSRNVGYWVHPVLRFIGPLPATAWLPIAFFTFPSSWSASTFLIALATGFPVTVLTWSGVASVSNAYYDVARTLGAKPSFLVLKVAIPAALPHVFVGLFMGLRSTSNASATPSTSTAMSCRCSTMSISPSSPASSSRCSVHPVAASRPWCGWSRGSKRRGRACSARTAIPSPDRFRLASWCSRIR